MRRSPRSNAVAPSASIPVHGIWIITDHTRSRLGNLLLKPVRLSAGGRPSVPVDVEVGWHLHPDAWGNGYATEAARAAVADAFSRGLHRVIAITHPHNQAFPGGLPAHRDAPPGHHQPIPGHDVRAVRTGRRRVTAPARRSCPSAIIELTQSVIGHSCSGQDLAANALGADEEWRLDQSHEVTASGGVEPSRSTAMSSSSTASSRVIASRSWCFVTRRPQLSVRPPARAHPSPTQTRWPATRPPRTRPA